MGRGAAALSRSIAPPPKPGAQVAPAGGRNKAARSSSKGATSEGAEEFTVQNEAAAAQAALAEAEAERLRKELQDAKDYTEQLKALLEQQQAQIDTLNSKVAAAAMRPTTAPAHPKAFFDPSPRKKAFEEAQASSPTPAPDTAWGRLRMTKARLEELINIVFMELGGGKNLTVEDAVNGVRLLVTTGTGLDDIAYSHPLAMTTNSASVDVAAFSKICTDSLLSWDALAPGAAN